ncbi:von Willebrand factor A domain-containing protein 1 [Coregonus clupeaformis]|uniref:von Willebrand factor A domain-containing protein 1 n=1 Tax=Coregonus suidteri TaxID=861788 RepID=A0AAN8L3T0_9TELE|nr:von Willebrand factor A domain-containing protein 1 [Coregonus clupeaformis]
MESRILFTCMLVCVFLRSSCGQNSAPEAVLNCCEGDVLFLLDSSGSVSSYDYFRMLRFLSELLLPFSLGEDQVRVSLLQVGTQPRLEFGFDGHNTQTGLQEALRNTKPLGGDTNTEEALRLAKDWVLKPGGSGGAREDLPRVLVWLTDGVKPGDVIGPMKELREEGVSVLVISTGHGNYQVLRQVVTPPVESHLYFVDIDDMSIITEDLRDAIIEILRAERLQVRDVSTDSAVLQWRPVLAGLTGYYEIRFRPVPSLGVVGGGTGGPGTSPSTSGGQYQRLTRPGDSSTARLTGLKPDTTYKATLTPESNLQVLNPLSVNFTTKPEVLSPAVVTVSDSGANSVRVSWGPLQPESVQSFQVEYMALPGGKLHTATVGRGQNSTVLTNLQPDTQYLVTVSARHSSGRERAMSVKVCTEEVRPALADLQLTTVGSDSVQVDWKASVDGLRGYWLTWEGQDSHGSTAAPRSSLYLPPNSLSTRLTHLPPATRVCVSPVYRTARGEGLCCTAQFHSDASVWGHRS